MNTHSEICFSIISKISPNDLDFEDAYRRLKATLTIISLGHSLYLRGVYCKGGLVCFSPFITAL